MTTHKTNPLDQLVTQRLAAIKGERIPAAARTAIDADILAACAGLIQERITGKYVGKMVGDALAVLEQEGRKGEAPASPLPSKTSAPSNGKGQEFVAGQAANPLSAHDPTRSTSPLIEDAK